LRVDDWQGLPVLALEGKPSHLLCGLANKNTDKISIMGNFDQVLAPPWSATS
jgi:hypothetical protein